MSQWLTFEQPAHTEKTVGREVGILDDQVYFAHYLIALARLTLEGRRVVNAARGEQEEIAS